MSYLLGAGPRPTVGLPSRPGNVQLRPKDDGPAVLTKAGNSTNVRGTTQRGVRNTTRVCRLRVQHLDQRQHLETDRLDVLQAGYLYEQRHRGLAPWPKSPSVWTNTTSAVPSDPASSQGSEADSNSDPPGVRKEAATNSATKVQRAAAENLRAVGPVRGRGEISKTTTEGLLLSQWTSRNLK